MFIRKYSEIFKITLSNSLAYFMDTVLFSVFIMLIIFVLINLWVVIYASKSFVEGYTVVMIIWYLLLSESIVTAQGELVEDVNESVKSGNVTYELLKPYNYVLYHFFNSFGRAVVRFVTIFILGALLVLWLVGPLNFNLWHMAPLILVVLFALIIDFLFNMIIGLMAFWMEDSTALKFAYMKFVFTVGGMLVPLEVFPNWLSSISKALPFSYIAYHPAHLFVDFSWQAFAYVLLMQLLWIACIGIVLYFVYSACIKKININGG